MADRSRKNKDNAENRRSKQNENITGRDAVIIPIVLSKNPRA